MTWVDFVILALLLVSAVLAYVRGLVGEVLGVGAWIGAAVAGLFAEPQVQPLIAPHVSPDWLATGLAVGGVFLAALIVLKLVIAWICGRIRRSALGGVDRALGTLFGLARGAFVVVLTYVVGGLLLPATDRWPEPVRAARSLPLAEQGARWLVAQLPDDVRPRLPEAGGRAAPPLEQLLRPPARERT
jgi:membrane protein required for colicin V production